MNLRVRGPASQATLSGVEPDLSIAEFQALLAERTGVAAEQQEVLSGFPPKQLQLEGLGEGATVAALPLRNGESLTVRVRAGGSGGSSGGVLVAASQPAPGASAAASPAAAAEQPMPAAAESGGASAAAAPPPAAALGNFGAGASGASAPAGPPPVLPQHSASQPSGAASGAGGPGSQPAVSSGGAGPDWAAQQMDEDEALARAIAASLEDAPGGGSAEPASAPALPAGGFDADSRHRPDGSLIVRRVIDADNSCLFNAVGYVMESGNRRSADRLRALIARTVADDPETFTEAFLERPNAEYCAWILDEQKWGGAIELSILSKYYGREIAAYDIQTQRCDVYGSEEGYTERVMVLYDGLHYDALALAAWPDAAERLDVTTFPTSGPVCQEAARGAAELVALAHTAHAFTNTADFTLRCGVCQQGIRGETEAREHARLTGHQNFQEYR